MKQKIWSNGRSVSAVGLGTWQLGADWGDVNESDARAVLDAAVGSGVTFFDTADVYGDGRSEQFIGRYLSDNPGHDIFVATKMGRRVDQLAKNYHLDAFREWTDRSRKNLGVDRLDLVQLHCPPTAVIDNDAIFDALDSLVAEDRIASYGVSVEESAQAVSALRRPALASIQIIINAFRLKPFDEVIPKAAAAGVSIIARVPLASGLLTGRFSEDTTFAENDHRTFNRAGQAFDVGETFSGVDYADGVAAAREFVAQVPDGMSPAQAALAWLVEHDEITTVIPGARSPEQARANGAAGSIDPLGPDFDAAVTGIYDKYFRAAIHERW